MYYVIVHDKQLKFRYLEIEADSPALAAAEARKNTVAPDTILVFDTPPLYEKRTNPNQQGQT